MMLGERILARSLSAGAVPDRYNNLWQYHPRSDRHSKIVCWGILFDLLRYCPLLRKHAGDGRIAFGINHEMTDFVSSRRKNLDLVVCIPRETDKSPKPVIFRDLLERYSVDIADDELAELDVLPVLRTRPVGDVLVALEAKACMTAHTKAAPRLFDELSSAAQCINGSAPNAIAVGSVLVNASPEFVSPDRNKHHLTNSNLVISHDTQPSSMDKALQTARKLRLRGHSTERGFDAAAVTMILGVNDGSPYAIAPIPPSLQTQ